MSMVNSIRQMWREGASVAKIARRTGVSRDTVHKYRDKDDFSRQSLSGPLAHPSLTPIKL